MIRKDYATILIYLPNLSGVSQRDLFVIMHTLGILDFCYGDNDYVDGQDYVVSIQGPIEIKLNRFTINNQLFDENNNHINDPVLQDISSLKIEREKLYELYFSYADEDKEKKCLNVEYWNQCKKILFNNSYRLFETKESKFNNAYYTKLIEILETDQ